MKTTPMLCIILAAATVFAIIVLSASQAPIGTGDKYKGPIGLQLYSLRDLFSEDVPGTLSRVRDYGFKYVELAGTYGLTPEKFNQELAAKGLQAIGGHFAYDRFRDDISGVIAEAKALGMKYAGCAWIPHEEPFDEKQCRESIAVFNRAGAALAKEGLIYYYHIHGYEFRPYGPETLMDLLIKETDPKFVAYEMDVFWTYFAGQDPVQWLQKYPGRWELMHLKDMRKGVTTGGFSGRTDVRNDVILGTGQINLAAILKAATNAGIQYYFLEDESPDAAMQIPQSLKFLQRVTW